MSLIGTRLRPRPPKLPSMTAVCSNVEYKSSQNYRGRARKLPVSRCSSDDNGGTLRNPQRWKARSLENVFIRSLVLAGSCRRCKEPSGRVVIEPLDIRRRYYSSQAQYAPFRREEMSDENETSRREDDAQAEDLSILGQHIPQSGYRELVETYDSPSDMWEQPSHGTSTPALPKQRVHMPLAPRLVLTPEQEDRPPYTARRILPPEDEYHDMALRQFNRLLDRPFGTSTSQIWTAYQRLQGPRPRYLSDMAIGKVFRHLSWVEFKDSTSSQSYFAFLNEVLGERLPVLTHQWNSAISFAARWLKHTTSDEVKKAIETWLRMENAGAQANNVTFNILFDAAIRAGRFALADTICDEIKERGLKLDRPFRVSMIFYAGLRGDGDSVRQAFQELVNAGEIVDTPVMNCVIVSLIRAGEGASAESAYIKMKHLHETKFGTPGPRNWRERRMRGIEMTRTAQGLRNDKQKHESSFFGASFSSDDKKEEAQRRAPIHPDAHTYRILIKHYATTSGNLERCRELLTATKDGGWPLHGSIYLYLLKGFYRHGGHAYTPWNRRSLEELWADFIDASSPEKLRKAISWAKAEQKFDQGEDTLFFSEPGEDGEEVGPAEVLSHEETPPFITVGLTMRAIYAFYKCAGRKRMLQVWEQIQERWTDMTHDEKLQVEKVINRLVMDDSRYVE